VLDLKERVQRERLTGILARPGLANAERRLGGGTQDRRPATTAEAVLHLVRADRLAIVITANKAPDDERRAVEAGAHGPLAKPISPRRLCEVVDALASGAAPHPTP